jgi:Rrf2 family protein
MIGKSGVQALQAVALLARLGQGEYAGAAALARRTGAPENYLGKLLCQLRGRGLLESQRGAGGGFRLARAAARIPLLEVVGALEPVERWSSCVFGRAECSERDPCPLHHRFEPVRDGWLGLLRELTVADLATDAGNRRR